MVNQNSNPAVNHDVVVKRIFNAPVERVWQAFTDPHQVQRWWGPKDWTSPFCKIDLRVGGKYLFAMQAPEYQGGMLNYSTGVFTTIDPLKVLVYTHQLSDQHGNPIDPAEAGMPPDFPKEILTTVVFKSLGQQTEVVLTESPWTPGQMREYSVLGLNQTFDKLAESLL